MKNLLDKLLFLGAILCLSLVLTGATREGLSVKLKIIQIFIKMN